MLVYMDGIVIRVPSTNAINKLIHALSSSFPIKDLSRLNYFLGIVVVLNSKGITLMQHKYASDLLNRAHMENYKNVSTLCLLKRNRLILIVNFLMKIMLLNTKLWLDAYIISH